MKKLFVIFCLLIGLQFQTKAQVDIQLNPIAILFEVVQVTVDVPISRSGSIEGDLVVGDGSFGIIGLGKYYMNPKLGADRFYIGGFLGGFVDEGGGLGFISGYKWVSTQGINFELALGIGRGTGDIEVLPYGKLTVGYRFGGKKD